MPVILQPSDFALWLDPETSDAGQLKSLLKPYPEQQTDLYPVSRRVNNPRNDDAGCIEPIK